MLLLPLLFGQVSGADAPDQAILEQLKAVETVVVEAQVGFAVECKLRAKCQTAEAAKALQGLVGLVLATPALMKDAPPVVGQIARTMETRCNGQEVLISVKVSQETLAQMLRDLR